MNTHQGITIEYKNNFFGTFMSTLVAVLVAVPVAMFVSYTILQTQKANASTNQTATASPVNTIGYPVYAQGAAPTSCSLPEGSGGAGGSMAYLPGGGVPQYVVNNTSNITQNETDDHSTVIRDSYNTSTNVVTNTTNTTTTTSTIITDNSDNSVDNSVTTNNDNDIIVRDSTGVGIIKGDVDVDIDLGFPVI